MAQTLAGFAQRLHALRKNKNLSQTELGQLAGLHYTQIGRFARGTSRPSGETLKRPADALGVTSDYLLGGAANGAAKARFEDRELLIEAVSGSRATAGRGQERRQEAARCLSDQEATSGAGALTAGDRAMNATVEQALITKIKALSPPQVAEVADFVEFLAAKSAKRAAFDRLLAIAPALEAAGVEPMSEEEIAAEVEAARAERRARLAAAGPAAQDTGADRS